MPFPDLEPNNVVGQDLILIHHAKDHGAKEQTTSRTRNDVKRTAQIDNKRNMTRCGDDQGNVCDQILNGLNLGA